MKKFSAYIFIGILALGIFAPFFEASAQPGPATGQQPQTGGARTGGAGQQGAQGEDGDRNVAPVSVEPSEEAGDCSWRKPSTWLFGCFMGGIGLLIMGITSGILWLAGSLLNIVLDVTIIGMSENIKQFTGINTAWELVRDVINIIFIFILIWQGIKMIIGLSSTDYVKKFIGFLVLASLLVNFSLFFTKVMVDASNAVTIGLYNAIITESTTEVPGGSRGSVSGLSVAYMKALDLSKLYSVETFSTVAGTASAGITLFVGQIIGSILFVITAFVFFAISILFIIRYITILILFMLSPVAFMGMALPAIKGYSNQWWDSLRGQLIFPPVFMFMTWVVLTLLSSMFTQPEGDANVAMGSPGLLSLVFNFVIIIGLALFTIIQAKKTASEGSSMIGQATGMLNSFAGKALLGTSAAVTSWGMRKTIGARALRESENEDLKARAAAGDKRAQARLATARKLASSSFDIRATSGLQKVAKATGVDLGKGSVFNEKAGVGGYKAHLEAKKKEKEKYIEGLKPSDEYKKAVDDRIAQSAEAKAEEEAAKALENQEKITKKKEGQLEKLEEELEKAVAAGKQDIADQTRARIETKNLEIEASKKIEDELRKTHEEMEKAKKDFISRQDTYQNRANTYAQTIENPRAAKTKLEKDKADADVATKTKEITEKEKEKEKLNESLKDPAIKGTPEEQKISDQIKALDNEISRENKNLEGLVQVQTEATKKHTEALEKGSRSILEAAKDLATISAGGVVGAVTGGIAGIPFGLPGILVGAGTGGVAGARASKTISREERSQIANAVRKKPGKKKELSDKEKAKQWSILRDETKSESERKAAAEKLDVDYKQATSKDD